MVGKGIPYEKGTDSYLERERNFRIIGTFLHLKKEVRNIGYLKHFIVDIHTPHGSYFMMSFSKK